MSGLEKWQGVNGLKKGRGLILFHVDVWMYLFEVT